MKKLSRLCALVLVVATLLTCTSCVNDGSDIQIPDLDESSIVMRYGDLTLNEKEFMYIVSYLKSYYVTIQQSAYYQMYYTVLSEKEILALPITEDKVLADYIKEMAVSYAQQVLIIEQLCADAGISITNQSDLDAISDYIADVEYAYGGSDLFDIALIRMGFSRSGIERMQRHNLLWELLSNYRYGDSGVAKIPSDTVTKDFTENYLSYEGFAFGYVDESSAGYINFEFSDDEIKEYYENNYVKVRHILYKTSDSNANEKKAEAEADLANLLSGEKSFADLIGKNEDSSSEYVFTYGTMVDSFETAAFEMSVGEIRLVETEFGYHIVEKLENPSDVLFTDDDDAVSSKKSLITEMSKAKIKNKAIELMDMFNNGEITEFPEEIEGFDSYTLLSKDFIDKNSDSYTDRIKVINDLEIGKCDEYDSPTEAIYVYKRLDFSADEITSTIYSSIEADLIVESFYEYVTTFYDRIEIDNELLEKFDVLTIPLLEEEFYTE